MDNLSQEELKESIDALNKFLNTCKSSSQSIELRSFATEMSYKDYQNIKLPPFSYSMFIKK